MNVLTLKKSVPANWISEARLSAGVSDRRSCRNAALVKKIEPTKNVTPRPGRGTDAHWEMNDATAKHVEPIANSTPIHQSPAAGRHHRTWRPGAAGGGWTRVDISERARSSTAGARAASPGSD